MAKVLTEKQVVDYIVDNWDKFFPEFKFHRKEHSYVEGWRCDIGATIDVDLKEIGYRTISEIYKAMMFIEVKYKHGNGQRDLIYELEKAKYLRYYLGERLPKSWPAFIAVLSDDYSDETIVDYLIENDIHMYKIDIQDDKLETLKISYYEPKNLIIERA